MQSLEIDFRKVIVLWNLVLELSFFLFTTGVASDFWKLVKCARYRNRVLRDSSMLNAFIRHLEPTWIINEGPSMDPELGSCRNDIVHYLDARTNAILILANSFLLVELVIATLSYSPDPYYPLFNVVAFCSAIAIKPTVQSKHLVLEDVQMVPLYLYKWNLDGPYGCLVAVSTKIPQLSNALYPVRQLRECRLSAEPPREFQIGKKAKYQT